MFWFGSNGLESKQKLTGKTLNINTIINYYCKYYIVG